ncbi:hypothetical protein PHLGIDRAFT_379363 [Phlebiopsis gigantea 11061_1 CR5-6]|uniref:Uncharacterized protein n=1 Tax=Phlebiopsis gigantea (strain 11061_1 CR5-6) TaxID=745531 RepID=A0A0C3P960_PHLG1|nr:hypothetical protein PHLGIDRAFT_379363 [Phlebiopsis gigantea 11061_1 CR5-6]
MYKCRSRSGTSSNPGRTRRIITDVGPVMSIETHVQSPHRSRPTRWTHGYDAFGLYDLAILYAAQRDEEEVVGDSGTHTGIAATASAPRGSRAHWRWSTSRVATGTRPPAKSSRGTLRGTERLPCAQRSRRTAEHPAVWSLSALGVVGAAQETQRVTETPS